MVPALVGLVLVVLPLVVWPCVVLDVLVLAVSVKKQSTGVVIARLFLFPLLAILSLCPPSAVCGLVWCLVYWSCVERGGLVYWAVRFGVLLPLSTAWFWFNRLGGLISVPCFVVLSRLPALGGLVSALVWVLVSGLNSCVLFLCRPWRSWHLCCP